MTEKSDGKESQMSKEYIRHRKSELQNELQTISVFLSSIDLSASWMNEVPSHEDNGEEHSIIDGPSVEIQNMLNKTYPISQLTRIKEMIIEGLDEGWFTPYDGKNLTYGRLCKAEKNGGISIETVVMTSTGPAHIHPFGEFDLCFTLEGEACFDGFEEGWVVYPPTSWHVPTVTNGKMAILYFLPEGKIQFQRSPVHNLEERKNILKEHQWQSNNI